MRTFIVTIPIAGHLSFEVEAENEAEAKDKAYDSGSSEGELSYETLDSFCSGNVCHCPSPWKIEVEEI